MKKKNPNYTGVIVKNEELTNKMLEDLEKCVRGKDEPVCFTNVVPTHVREEYIRAGLPEIGLYDGMWICSEEFKSSWAHYLDVGNNKTLIVFPKRVAAKFMNMYNFTKRAN